MRESRTYGSARGAPGNRRPYRNSLWTRARNETRRRGGKCGVGVGAQAEGEGPGSLPVASVPSGLLGNMGRRARFPHRRLEAYSLAFCFHICLNLGEGAAAFSPGDQRRFFRIALASAGECATILDLLSPESGSLEVGESPLDLEAASRDLSSTAALTVGLIRRQ